MLATLALGGALTACTNDQPNPLAPSESTPSAIVSATGSGSAAAMLSGDAVTRILPALQKDAAVPVGRALKDLDAKLRDGASSVAARDRATTVVDNTLAQFTNTGRADAADLDAMRLAVAEIRTLLHP